MNDIYITDKRFELHGLHEYIKPNCILKRGPYYKRETF